MLTLCAAAGAMLGGCPPGATERTYTITVENLTSGQPFSPIVAATHSNAISMFRVGETASEAIRAIAEDGDPEPMVAALEDALLVTDVVNVGAPIVPNGSTAGGFSDTATFEITAYPWDVLSLAGMLIATNDGIVGVDSTGLPLEGTKIIYALGFDAGTEENTEASEDIVDPASGIGPVALEGDPNGNDNAGPDTSPQEAIRLHPGIEGGGDLTPELHGWPEPTARVTITVN